MATISKFYFHDAATTNTGTMPTGAMILGGDTTGDATGALTARLTNDVIGVSQTSATITSNADQLAQAWGYRRFVSPPLAARTFGSSEVWRFSYARSENNLLHNQAVNLKLYLWRPGTGARVGTLQATWSGAEPGVAGAQETQSFNNDTWANGPQDILDGDIVVFDVSDQFTQGMSTAYTSSFFYDGTTEASTTSCASFVTPPAALTLFTAPVPATPLPLHQSVPFYPRASRPS